jgi:hypothetical protein
LTYKAEVVAELIDVDLTGVVCVYGPKAPRQTVNLEVVQVVLAL